MKTIHDYISTDAETYASVFISELMEKVDSLPEFPEIGRIVPEMDNKKLREIFFSSYRIIYKISKDRIEIVTVIHQRMKLLIHSGSLGDFR